MSNYRLGVIADSFDDVESLKKLTTSCGFVVIFAQRSESIGIKPLPQVDAWVVRLDLNQDVSHAVYERLEQTNTAIMFDDGLVENTEPETLEEQTKRFVKKINECIAQSIKSVTSNNGSATPGVESIPADSVCILAASTGGPEAVNAFLSELSHIPKTVAFLYVQHMDANMHESLRLMLKKHRYLTVEDTIDSKRILGGRLYLINPDEQIDVTPSGVLVPTLKPWQGCYKPSIDQVMAKVVRCFKERSAVIIFSGMGNDGSASCRFFKSYGGEIYTQSTASCTIDSMPLCATQACDISFDGTPQQLAQQFLKRFELVA